MLSASALSERCGLDISDVQPLSRGHNATLYNVTLEDGAGCVAKIVSGGGRYADSLEPEGWMLRYLATHSELPVPDVLYNDDTLLLMTCLHDSGHLNAHAEEHAAELLAALHRITREQYGLERDTLIGPLHQPNTAYDDWCIFFGEQRLHYMARHALEEGRLDSGLMSRLDRLIKKLPELIGTPAPPSLIHGDIWGGNVLCADGRISGFIDPALYYADPEIELAFTTMFGTFGEAFFAQYHALLPIRDGFFELRKDLYLLYPLLVHVRIYGGGYVGSVERIVSRHVS